MTVLRPSSPMPHVANLRETIAFHADAPGFVCVSVSRTDGESYRGHGHTHHIREMQARHPHQLTRPSAWGPQVVYRGMKSDPVKGPDGYNLAVGQPVP